MPNPIAARNHNYLVFTSIFDLELEIAETLSRQPRQCFRPIPHSSPHIFFAILEPMLVGREGIYRAHLIREFSIIDKAVRSAKLGDLFGCRQWLSEFELALHIRLGARTLECKEVDMLGVVYIPAFALMDYLNGNYVKASERLRNSIQLLQYCLNAGIFPARHAINEQRVNLLRAVCAGGNFEAVRAIAIEHFNFALGGGDVFCDDAVDSGKGSATVMLSNAAHYIDEAMFVLIDALDRIAFKDVLCGIYRQSRDFVSQESLKNALCLLCEPDLLHASDVRLELPRLAFDFVQLPYTIAALLARRLACLRRDVVADGISGFQMGASSVCIHEYLSAHPGHARFMASIDKMGIFQAPGDHGLSF